MQSLSEQAQAFAHFQECLVRSARDLFRTYGLSVEHSLGAAAAHVASPSVMAVIGYASPTVRGALLLLSSPGVVSELVPQEIRTTPPTEAILRDVLGEFSNMLIGRIKNKLATRNIAPLVSTPTTILGDALKLPVPTSGMSAWHKFGSAQGDIFVRLDAAFEPDFALEPAELATETSIAEGEMVVF